MKKINISRLSHTWILDLDGTIVEHNGYLQNGHDEMISEASKLLDQIPSEDMIIILTSRNESYKELTLEFLRKNNIRYDEIIFNVPYGERILINDSKPSGLATAIAVNCERNKMENIKVYIDDKL